MAGTTASESLSESFVLKHLRKVLRHGWGEVRVVVTDHAVQRADVNTQHRPQDQESRD